MEPIVVMKDVFKRFGGIHAVEGMSLDMYPGEVVGLLGHNGAGKSTFIKMLSGAYSMDAGEIFVDGKPAQINNPIDAKDMGIETIYQTLALADNLDTAANIFFGREILTPWRALDEPAMEHAAIQVMRRLNPAFSKFHDPVRNSPVASVSPSPLPGHCSSMPE